MYRMFSLKIRKTLLGPVERAAIVATMKASGVKSARVWAMQFKRLPATIRKIAGAEGIRVNE